MSVIEKLLKQGNAAHAANQVMEAGWKVDTEPPVRGRQPLQLAAAQLAILLAAKEGTEDNLGLADRLIALSEREDQAYVSKDMVEEALTPEESLFYPSAKAIVGLIAASLERGA